MAKHTKASVQIVIQGEALKLEQHLKEGRIAYTVVDQPGPMVLRVAAADWAPVLAIATEHGYGRPDFYCQSDSIGRDPFKELWLRKELVGSGLHRSGAGDRP